MKFIILCYLSHMQSLSRILNAHAQPFSGTTVLNKDYFSHRDLKNISLYLYIEFSRTIPYQIMCTLPTFVKCQIDFI